MNACKAKVTGLCLASVLAFDVQGYSLSSSSWPQGQAEIRINLAASNPTGVNPPNIVAGGPSTVALQAAYIDAMNIWNASSTFFYIADTGSGWADPCVVPSGTGVNGVKFDTSQCGSAFGATTLAVQQNWFSGPALIQTGTVFNNNKSWDIYSGPYTGVAEFKRVAVHELGHGLGLQHEDVVPAIMNTLVGDLEAPQADDLAGVAQFYDVDADGIGLAFDNCPDAANPSQSDIDNDALGDDCDNDIDNDGVWNSSGNDIVNDPSPSSGSFYSFGPMSTNSAFSYAAQSFIAGISGDLESVTLPVYCPSGTITVSIRNASGSPSSGSPLASQVFNSASGLPSTYAGGVTFDFSSPAPLVAGNQYAVVLIASYDCRWFISSTSYAGGSAYLSTNNISWSSLGVDVGFSTFMLPSPTDNCPFVSNPSQIDTDLDGIGDACELLDSDGDGVEDNVDNCPNLWNADQLDNDMDGLGDVCDVDDDNDGLIDTLEAVNMTDPFVADTDGDGVNDGDEVAAGTNPLVPDAFVPATGMLSQFALLGAFAFLFRRTRRGSTR